MAHEISSVTYPANPYTTAIAKSRQAGSQQRGGFPERSFPDVSILASMVEGGIPAVTAYDTYTPSHDYASDLLAFTRSWLQDMQRTSSWLADNRKRYERAKTLDAAIERFSRLMKP